jgi:hypothetical protein
MLAAICLICFFEWVLGFLGLGRSDPIGTRSIVSEPLDEYDCPRVFQLLCCSHFHLRATITQVEGIEGYFLRCMVTNDGELLCGQRRNSRRG